MWRISTRHLGQCGKSLHREFVVEDSYSDLHQAVRALVSPSHLLLLRHAMADYLIHRGLGNAAADRQPLAVVSTKVNVRQPDHRPFIGDVTSRVTHLPSRACEVNLVLGGVAQ